MELNVDRKANNPITRTARRGAATTATPNTVLSSFTPPDRGNETDTLGKDSLGRDRIEMDKSDEFCLSTFTSFGLFTFIYDSVMDEITCRFRLKIIQSTYYSISLD